MNDYAQPILKKSRWYTLIWSIPLLTAIMASFLLFNYYENRGVLITIDFTNGSGLIASKTKIRYEGIDIGIVEKISLINGDNKVRVHARLNPSAAHLACKGALFWVVQARFSLGGVSGLDTIISGKYINIRPASKGSMPQARFVGLEEPPMGEQSLPGLFIALRAQRLESLTPGTAVLYKQIKVGKVEGYELLANNEVKVFLYIEQEFAHLVRTTTRFWNAGGIRVSGGLSGFKVQTDTIAAMMSGGVTFDTPRNNDGEPASTGQIYTLYNGRQEALSGVSDRDNTNFHPGLIITVSFENAEGIVSGKTEVKYKGIVIGKVLSRTIADDLSKVNLTIMLHPEAGQATQKGTRFWVVKPSFGSQGISGLSTLLNGRYIEVRPGDGEVRTEFIGLEKPLLDEEGLHIHLQAENGGSLSAGSPILYRQVEVGQIAGISLAKDGGGVELFGLIFEPYADLVRDTTRFWNTSGIKVKADMGGVELQIASLASLLTGGLEFETPVGTGKPAQHQASFTLYPDREAARELGERIQVSFASGVNLSSGADLRYRGVAIGEVKNIRLNPNMDGVIAEIYVDEIHNTLLRTGARFWVARPAIGLMGVENLDTVIRGGYVEIEPGTGEIKTRFVGLEAPPLDRPDSVHVTLRGDRLGALQVGSPVFYRNLQAGVVVEVGLGQDGKGVDVTLMLQAPFSQLVGDNTLFYRSGGVQVNASLNGIDVSVESFAAMMTGGISFSTEGGQGQSLKPTSRPILFRNLREAKAAQLVWKSFELTANQTGSLSVGRPVYYRGVQVGEILGVALGDTADHVVVTIGVESRYGKLVRRTSLFWNASGIGLDISLFGGAKMRTQSLDAILAGGVAFINPDDNSEIAPAGASFILHDKPRENWLKYKRKFPAFLGEKARADDV